MRGNGRLPPLPPRPRRSRAARSHGFRCTADARQLGGQHVRLRRTTPGRSRRPRPAPAELSPEDALQAAFAVERRRAPASTLDASIRAQGQSRLARAERRHGRRSAKQPAVEVDVKLDVPGTKVERRLRDGRRQGLLRRRRHRLPRSRGRLAERRERGRSGERRAARRTRPSCRSTPRTWVENVKSEGSETIDGVETEHVSASVDAPKAAKRHHRLRPAAGRGPGRGSAAAERGGAGREGRQAGRPGRVGRQGGQDPSPPDRGRRARRARHGCRDGLARAEPDRRRRAADDRALRPRSPRSFRAAPSASFMRTALESSATVAGGDPSLIRAGLEGVTNPQKLKNAPCARTTRSCSSSRTRAASTTRPSTTSVRSVKRGTKAVVLTDLVVNLGRYGTLVEGPGRQPGPRGGRDRHATARPASSRASSTAASLVQVVTDAR